MIRHLLAWFKIRRLYRKHEYLSIHLIMTEGEVFCTLKKGDINGPHKFGGYWESKQVVGDDLLNALTQVERGK